MNRYDTCTAQESQTSLLTWPERPYRWASKPYESGGNQAFQCCLFYIQYWLSVTIQECKPQTPYCQFFPFLFSVKFEVHINHQLHHIFPKTLQHPSLVGRHRQNVSQNITWSPLSSLPILHHLRFPDQETKVQKGNVTYSKGHSQTLKLKPYLLTAFLPLVSQPSSHGSSMEQRTKCPPKSHTLTSVIQVASGRQPPASTTFPSVPSR